MPRTKTQEEKTTVGLERKRQGDNISTMAKRLKFDMDD